MIPYFIAFLLLGIPICWAEWSMGRYAGRHGFHSCPAIFAVLGRNRLWRYLGIPGLIIPVVVYMYYVIIESWCLTYALSYLFGWIKLGDDATLYAARSKDFFSQLSGIGADGSAFTGGCTWSLAAFVAVLALNFGLIYRGLVRGIEGFCKWAMPVMALCALVVLARVLTLGTPNPELPEQNVLNGLGFMWNPHPAEAGGSWVENLLDPGVWLAAAGQIFFSLSVGFGVVINYASYLKRNDDVVLSGLTASATNEFFEVALGGLTTVTAAFVFLGAAGAVGGVFGLGFNALPIVFMHMPAGNIFGFIWFFMLFLAAITSSISMLQPGVAFLREGLGMGRKSSVIALALLTGAGSLFVLYFSKDLLALDTMDFWVGTALIYISATLQVILFGWVLGVERGVASAHEGARMFLPKVFPFVIKYISPVYLLGVFGLWCYKSAPQYLKDLAQGGVPLWTVCFILGVLALVVIIVHIGGRTWHAQPDD